MKRIKFECWWTDSHSITNRIINQFIFPEDLEKYQFVIDSSSDYDYLVVLGRTDFSNINLPKDKIFVFSQEPIWSPNDSKNLHLFSDNVFVSDLSAYEKNDSYKEILLPMLYAGRGEQDYREEWNWSKKFFDTDFSTNKTNKISMVLTNNYNSHLNYLSNPDVSEIL